MLAILTMSVLAALMEQKAAGQIITQPQSTSAFVNEVGTFNCSGTSVDLFWVVNGKVGFTESTTYYSYDDHSMISSTLYITALVENNNLSVKCVVLITPKTNHFSPTVYLAVLGIGKIPWIEFDNTTFLSNCISWGKPYASNDITDLAYYVNVTGKSGYLSNSTSATYFCMEYTFCQEYNVTVTPYSTNYTGTTISTTVKIDGGSYSWDGPCSVKVTFAPDDSAVALFACKLTAPDVVCPDQSVVAVCSSYTNGNSTSVQIGPLSIETILYNESLINIEVPNLPMAEKLFCDFSLKDVDDVDLGLVHQNFSTFSIENISVTEKHTSAGVYVTASPIDPTLSTVLNAVSSTLDPHPTCTPSNFTIIVAGAVLSAVVLVMMIIVIVGILAICYFRKSKKWLKVESPDSSFAQIQILDKHQPSKPNYYCDVKELPENTSKEPSLKLCPLQMLPKTSDRD